jgi:TolB-like protein/DNA-binding SARP family transcriptional activator/cytochrome c-type biogenesis protein CcmH/NrfG
MIHVQTFGALDVRRDGVEVRSLLSQPKRLALFVHVLLSAPGGFANRDALLARFWPESDDERGRNSLRQALHYLRRSLGEGVLVARGEREIGCDAARVTCDAADFERAIAAGLAETALELYRGDFMPAFYVEDAPEIEAWIDEQRGRYRRLAFQAATRLAEREAAAGELRAAVLWTRRALAIQPHDEAAARQLIGLLAELGERAGALAAYDEFAARLLAEHEIEPSAGTRALVASIRDGAAPRLAPSSAPSAAAPTAAAADQPPGTPIGAWKANSAGDGARRFAAGATSSLDGSAGAASADVRSVPPAGTGFASRRARALRYAAAALVALVGFAGWQARAGKALVESSPAVAVLPFVNLSGDPAHEYFADGIAEELLTVLASVPGLKVAARTSSFSFRGKDVPADSIARALGVTHVLEGSVRAVGGRIRVNAQLVDAARGFRVWSESYDRGADDIFVLQDEISRAIARALQLELSPAIARPPERETKDAEAYRLVLRATQVMRTGSTRDVMAEAAALFEEAVRRDPGYARALAGLANVLSAQAGARYIDAPSGYARARELAERSLAIRPGIEAHLVLARDAEFQRWDTAAADMHYRRALDLNPIDPRTLQFRALFLGRADRHDEAIAAARRAAELDPLHAGAHNNLAVVLRGAGRLDDALDAYHAALLVSPDDPIVIGNIANLFNRMQRYDEALAWVDRAIAYDPHDYYMLGLRVNILFASGARDAGYASIRELEARPDFPRLRLARLYTHVQEIDRILDNIEEAITRREDDVLTLRSPDMFSGLREHPRFVAALQQLEKAP